MFTAAQSKGCTLYACSHAVHSVPEILKHSSRQYAPVKRLTLFVLENWLGGGVHSPRSSTLIWKISLRTFAALCVLCGKETFKAANRKERKERKVRAKT